MEKSILMLIVILGIIFIIVEDISGNKKYLTKFVYSIGNKGGIM